MNICFGKYFRLEFDMGLLGDFLLINQHTTVTLKKLAVIEVVFLSVL